MLNLLAYYVLNLFTWLKCIRYAQAEPADQQRTNDGDAD